MSAAANISKRSTSCLNELDSKGISYRLLYMEASDEVLLQALQGDPPAASAGPERRHPGRHPPGARACCQGLKVRADWVIDTSDLNVHELRADIVKDVAPGGAGEFIVTFLSFGFKYGTPLDADLVFDVRFLPNPLFRS